MRLGDSGVLLEQLLIRDGRSFDEAWPIVHAHDDFGPMRFLAGHDVGGDMAALIAGAKRSVVIESPYFIPPRFFRELLLKKLSEGALMSSTLLRNTEFCQSDLSIVRLMTYLVTSLISCSSPGAPQQTIPRDLAALKARLES